MTLEERANLAANLKATGQCNCTQSVLKAFEDKINIYLDITSLNLIKAVKVAILT